MKEKRFRAGLTFGRFSVNDKNLRAFYGDWFKNIPGIEVSAHIMYNVDIWAAVQNIHAKSRRQPTSEPGQIQAGRPCRWACATAS